MAVDGDGPAVEDEVVRAYLDGESIAVICERYMLTIREAYAMIRSSGVAKEEVDSVLVAGLLQLIDMLSRRVEELERENELLRL